MINVVPLYVLDLFTVYVHHQATGNFKIPRPPEYILCLFYFLLIVIVRYTSNSSTGIVSLCLFYFCFFFCHQATGYYKINSSSTGKFSVDFHCQVHKYTYITQHDQ